MDIRPIKTKPDYQRALRRIATLMDAKPGTDEGDELDVLATLVDVYEEKHFPIEAADPVEAILFRMEQQGAQTERSGGIHWLAAPCFSRATIASSTKAATRSART